MPLNRFLTPISSFLCCRIPRWFPANALHPLHKLLILEHHFLPLQEWTLVLLSAFYFCERIFDCHSMEFPVNLILFSMCEFSSWHSSIWIIETVMLFYHYFIMSSNLLSFGDCVFNKSVTRNIMLSVSKIRCALFTMCLIYNSSHTNIKRKVVAV